MTTTNRNRLALVALMATAMVVGIAARLYDLQVRQAPVLRAQAKRQHLREVEIWPRRGAIVDRMGRELAVSVSSASLFAHPHRVDDPRKAAEALAPVLGVPSKKLLARLRSDEPFVWLRRRLDRDVADEARRVLGPLGWGDAFGFETEARRYYPQGSLAIHVIGFTDIDQQGIEGIEKVYDETLRGDRTGYLAFRDGRGGTVKMQLHPPARRPEDVVLSIDLVLQHIVERELDRAVRRTGARWASAILIEPRSGDVLAMANRPTAHPDAYGKTPVSARRNRAVTDAYEPGSTFKILTAAAALDTGRVDGGQIFHCGEGRMVLGDRTIHDHRAHGWLTLGQILEQSSNVGIVRVAQTLRDETLYAYLQRFGFDRRTGIELPGESRGLLAPLPRWSGSTRVSIAFGHEIAVTPLQMAVGFAAIANDGILAPPRVVLGTRDDEGRFRATRAGDQNRIVSSRTSLTLARMLEGVVLRGTGTRAAVAGYRIAGKTGTAQKPVPGGGFSTTDYVASFGGFAPARSPRIAGLVVLDSPRGEAHSGGAVAAPVFGEIVADALAYLRVASDDGPLLAVDARSPESGESARRRGTSDTIGELAPGIAVKLGGTAR